MKTMKFSLALVALLCVLWPASGELLLGERLLGMKHAAGTKARAAVAHSGYGEVLEKLVAFQDTLWSDCGFSGFFLPREQRQPGLGLEDQSAQVEFACSHDGGYRSHDGGYGSHNTGMFGGLRGTAGSCNWEFKFYLTPFNLDTPFPVLDDGSTLRLGKAKATCMLTREAQSCSAESPVCEDLILTIDADIFAAEAFWDAKAQYTPRFESNGGGKGQGSTCCASWLVGLDGYLNDGPSGFIQFGNQCGIARLPRANSTRAFQMPKKASGTPVRTASYYSEPHTPSTYISGRAILISGSVVAINARSNEFRNTGLFEWVPVVYCEYDTTGSTPVCITTTGTPPTTLLSVVPGQSRYKFFKDAPAYHEDNRGEGERY